MVLKCPSVTWPGGLNLSAVSLNVSVSYKKTDTTISGQFVLYLLGFISTTLTFS